MNNLNLRPLFLKSFLISSPVINARKRSFRRLCFYTCLSVILFTGGGGVHGCWGHAWLWGGHVWLQGGCMFAGGMRGCRGCVHGCRGACMVAGGQTWLLGVCIVAGGCVVVGDMCGCGGHAWWQGEACVGYDEIRSMSGRYASYWNAFLY